MAYQDKYLEYLKSVPEIIERCWETGNRPVLAYTSNLDAIATWDIDSFNRLLKQYLKEDPSFAEEETIDSMEDLVRILSYYVINGYGGEVEITSREVVETLKEFFEIQYGLGGTCAQGAAALGAMGIPVLTHITDQSREVLECMDYKGMESIKGGRRVSLKECVSGESPLIHLIIQFEKGDIVCANGKEYEIPLSNRLILDYDQVHKTLPIREEFLNYLENHAESIYSYDVSGFNAILDLDILKKKAEQLVRHYKAVKLANPEVKIYFESAHFISTKIRDYLYSTLSRYIDIMGMNEEELVDLTKKKEHPVDKDDIESVISGLDYLLEIYPVTGIIMHSKDYALYYGELMDDIDLEKGLTLGNLMSGTRARIGRYGSIKECEESLDLELSTVGMEFSEKIEKMNLKHHVILVPSRYMEKPKYTIGLGDTFVAGVQMCFVK